MIKVEAIISSTLEKIGITGVLITLFLLSHGPFAQPAEAKGLSYESTIASSKYYFGTKVEACKEAMRIGEKSVAAQCVKGGGTPYEDAFNYGNCACEPDLGINNGYRCTVGVNVKCAVSGKVAKKCKGTQLPRITPGYVRFRCLDCSVVDLKTGLDESGQLTLEGTTIFRDTIHRACNEGMEKRKLKELKHEFGIELKE